MTASRRRRVPLLLALLITLSVVGGSLIVPRPAPAAPAVPGNEGGSPLLVDVLESTQRGFLEAKRKYELSKRRQVVLNQQLKAAEQQVAALEPQVSEIAANSYRTGRLGPMLALLNSSTSDDFLKRAEALDIMALRDNAKLRALNEARDRARQAKLAIDREVAEAAKQTVVMKKQREEAEKALELVGGEVTGGFVVAKSPVARPAPRNSDGSWPHESCSENDPTTNGCITPRTLHALKEAQRVGFTWFVSCYRPGGPYEHPKGRACDFSSQKVGFGGDATGANKIYGNNLAAFLVRNADRLGVLYVIWYRQVWLPSTGRWKSYSHAGGDPSSDHTNHVHLSLI